MFCVDCSKCTQENKKNMLYSIVRFIEFGPKTKSKNMLSTFSPRKALEFYSKKDRTENFFLPRTYVIVNWSG